MFFSYRRYTHEKNPNNTGYGAQLSAISIPKKVINDNRHRM